MSQVLLNLTVDNAPAGKLGEQTMKRLSNVPNPFDAGECIKKRQAKRAIIEYDDNSRQILRKGIICWFDGDGKTYVVDYELIGLDERDMVVLGHSVVELGKKLLALRGNA